MAVVVAAVVIAAEMAVVIPFREMADPLTSIL
jgi:hypothetical protein